MSALKKISNRPPLSRQQKAVIVVRFLMQEGADIDLSTLPEPLQAALTQEIANLRLIDRETLADVVTEFAGELDSIGIAAKGGLGEALQLLDGKITRDTAKRLRQDAGVRLFEDPWPRIRALPNDELIPLLDQETVEVAAVILSKLPVSKAAEILSNLPGDRARRISFAISMTDAVTPIAVDRIGQVILAQIDNRPERAFAERPEDRIAAILTAADDRLREDVLNGLRDSEPELAQRAEQAIFTFDLIPTRIAATDVPKALKTADVGDLTLALAYAQSTGQTQITEFILDNLPKRLRASIEEELQAIDTVSPKQGSAAQTRVVGSIQNQISSGDVSLIQPDPD